MADSYTLDVQQRTILGKQVRQLRRNNLIPAVVYGAGGQPLSISCPRRPLEILLSKAGGTHIVTLNIIDGQPQSALVREVHRHPIRRDLIHVDFLRVDLLRKLRAEVPLLFVGLPKLGVDLTLAQFMTVVEVECLPKDIPDHIEVNISGLASGGDHVTVADLPNFEGVTYVTDSSDVIVRLDFTTANAADVAADAALAAAATPEPELAKPKGKKEDEDDAKK